MLYCSVSGQDCCILHLPNVKLYLPVALLGTGPSCGPFLYFLVAPSRPGRLPSFSLILLLPLSAVTAATAGRTSTRLRSATDLHTSEWPSRRISAPPLQPISLIKPKPNRRPPQMQTETHALPMPSRVVVRIC